MQPLYATALLAAIALPVSAATCESLAALSLPAVTIASAAGVPAGGFTPPGGKEIPNLPAFCRVTGSLRPSADSDIQFEVWLPTAGWNGRYLGTGNGGFAGAIGYGGLAEAVRGGYATSGTDTGHRAGGADAGWALGHPEKIVDYGHRAIHETAVAAKALVKAYYGDAPRRSYFNSCSNGGRQALMEAQRYPEDYDGIIAGAPANYFTHLLAAFVWDQQALLRDDASYIPASKLPAIEAAVMAACDANDGVKDGVIENPAKCRFDVRKLRCAPGGESDRCLTAAQVTALRKIYSGPPGFPGYPPGGEAHMAGWAAWVTGKAPAKSATYAFGTQFFANMVFGDPKWDFRTFQPARDTRVADERMGPILNAIDPDLSRFKSRGGKLILYHGWSDAAIPATNSVNYYRNVAAKMGAKETESFVRLYMAPGMQHCGSGDGPNNFGQGGAPKGDSRTNVGKALEEWVENGAAPGPIVARGGNRTRPLCPYPQVAEYTGTGSTDDAANFRCVMK